MATPRRAAYQGKLPVVGKTTLVGGTKTVNEPAVTANSIIMLSVQSLGTVVAPHPICVSARVPGTSFTILSDAGTDTSVVAYTIREP